MAEENEYEVKAVEKKAESIEDIVDKKILEEAPPTQPQEAQKQRSPRAVQRRGFQIPAIPADKILKTMTNKEMMMQTLHDETLEPHVHLVILLFIVFILAIIIALSGI